MSVLGIVLLAGSAAGGAGETSATVPVADLPAVQRPVDQPGAEATRHRAAERFARSAAPRADASPSAATGTAGATSPSQPPSPAPASSPFPEPAGVGPPPELVASSPPPPEPTQKPSPTPTKTGFPPVPGCDATVPERGEVANGRLGDGHLCPIGNGHRLRPDAAAAFLALDAAFQEATGSEICVTDSYRTLDQQRELKARKPRLAARPGTSNHGWGLAVDLSCGAETFGGSEHQWLFEHAPEYGWHNPAWARPNGSKPEPWHWEYEPSLLD